MRPIRLVGWQRYYILPSGQRGETPLHHAIRHKFYPTERKGTRMVQHRPAFIAYLRGEVVNQPAVHVNGRHKLTRLP